MYYMNYFLRNPEFFAPEIIKSGKCSLKVNIKFNK